MLRYRNLAASLTAATAVVVLPGLARTQVEENRRLFDARLRRTVEGAGFSAGTVRRLGS